MLSTFMISNMSFLVTKIQFKKDKTLIVLSLIKIYN